MDKVLVARAMNLWMKKFIDTPDEFEREFKTVLAYQTDLQNGEEPDYGTVCAAYIERLIAELE